MPPSATSPFPIGVCLVALLLLSSLGAAGVQPAAQAGQDASEPQAVDDLALPERVVLPQDQATSFAVAGPDAGGALDSSGSQLEGAYERYLLEERLADAETASERRAVLNRSVTDVERQIQRLRERERSARQAYRSGEIDTAAFLATLGSVNDRAVELERRANRISPPPTQNTDGLADVHGATTAASRIANLRADIIVLQGPVRGAIGERVRAESASQRFYVGASRNGTVLAHVADGTYYREATRPSVIARGQMSGLGLNEASELASDELYPQFTDNYGFSVYSTILNNRVYRLLGDQQYEHGSLESYVDAVSENVFWESQQMQLTTELPRASPTVRTSGDLSLYVRPTYDTGPASVRILHNGSAVSGESVTVDGEVVAETDEDGYAWVVLPDDSPTVTATVEGETASVTVNWNTI